MGNNLTGSRKPRRLTGKRRTDNPKPRRLTDSRLTLNPKPHRLTDSRLTDKGFIPRRRPTRFIRPCRPKNV